MRLRFIALAFLPLLGGCQTAFQVATYNGANPITPAMVTNVRLAYDAIEPLAIAYIQLPLCSAKHPVACSQASVSAQIKAANPVARTALRRLDTFVRTNPTVNAVSLFNEAVADINIVKAYVPAAASVPVPAPAV